MEPIFYVRGCYTVEAIKELRDYSLSPRWKLFIQVILGSLIFFSTIPMIIYRLRIDIPMLLIGIFFAIFVYWLNHLRLKSDILKLKRSGDENMEYMLYFFEDYFELEHSNGLKFQIDYKHIYRIVETANFFGFYTKGEIMFSFLKESLTPCEPKQWKAFMKNKNRKIYITIDKGAGKNGIQV